MGRLRRPVEAAGPLADLHTALANLHLRAGEPSTRAVARQTDALSHDTVHRVLTAPRAPAWGPLELVVEALGGDVETFRELWPAVRQSAGGAP